LPPIARSGLGSLSRGVSILGKVAALALDDEIDSGGIIGEDLSQPLERRKAVKVIDRTSLDSLAVLVDSEDLAPSLAKVGVVSGVVLGLSYAVDQIGPRQGFD
tara:strand:- start:1312 stop:1620 length:309 start_codon:yes stop_codon:yes gene_type:complete